MKAKIIIFGAIIVSTIMSLLSYTVSDNESPIGIYETIKISESDEFEFFNGGTNCFEKSEELGLYFTTANDVIVDYYNIYKYEPTQDTEWQWDQSIESYGTVNKINEYFFYDDNYSEILTMYRVTAIFPDGSEIILRQNSVDCTVPQYVSDCIWDIKNGTITSPNFNKNDIYVYDYTGNKVVNDNMQPGYYVLSLGIDGKCRTKINIGN